MDKQEESAHPPRLALSVELLGEFKASRAPAGHAAVPLAAHWP
jgi:hypothetical protein